MGLLLVVLCILWLLAKLKESIQLRKPAIITYKTQQEDLPINMGLISG
jgi:hypothetical protein